MRTFYEGWVRDRLPKAQALRQAQRRVMDLTATEVRAAYESRLAAIAGRDLVPMPDADADDAPASQDAKIFAAPYYWAAFTLVGDWR
jgi:CHAT domain-containing protein